MIEKQPILVGSKCSHLDCCRDAYKNYRFECSGGGIPYCASHYEQLRRGAVRTTDLRPRKSSGHHATSLRARIQAETVENCAVIAEAQGLHDFAKLLRRLRS